MHKVNEPFWMSSIYCFLGYLSFDFVYGAFVRQKLLVWIESNESFSFMVSGFCVTIRASIILKY